MSIRKSSVLPQKAYVRKSNLNNRDQYDKRILSFYKVLYTLKNNESVFKDMVAIKMKAAKMHFSICEHYLNPT